MRVYGVPPAEIQDLVDAAERHVAGRAWAGDRLWLATAATRELFRSEYFRYAREEEGDLLQAAGFINLRRDETDALATMFILALLSGQFGCRCTYQDDGHALAKLRYLEFRRGRLPSGQLLDDVIGTRPVIKRVGKLPVTFYPPQYRPTRSAEARSDRGWAYAVHGMRAFAPTFLEAEAEAMKVVTGFTHLDDQPPE
ncbi:MAG: hypothetical protein ACYDAY_11780 [Candidatus Dormibacteria bacterium]